MSVIGFKVDGDMIQYNFPNLDNKPTIDATPTANSTNAVQSGGVKSALDTLQAQIPQIDSTLSQSGQAADAKAVGDDLRFIKQNAHFKKVVISTVESGYYSTVNGSKQNNSASTHYNRMGLTSISMTQLMLIFWAWKKSAS